MGQGSRDQRFRVLPWNAVQIPAMRKAAAGPILNTASTHGQVGAKFSPAYVAAKHAVVERTKATALECADKNIRINAVGPGYTLTPLLTNRLTDEQMKAPISLHPIGRLGRPEEVAELVLFHSSTKASFVMGNYSMAGAIIDPEHLPKVRE